ncbi:unnamed protein product [Ixodes hexagonus]
MSLLLSAATPAAPVVSTPSTSSGQTQQQQQPISSEFTAKRQPEAEPVPQPRAEPAVSSGAVPKRVPAVQRSRARRSCTGRIQRQASVCLPWDEEPQCSHWDTCFQQRRLSVPARLVPPRDLSGEGWCEVPSPLRESASTEAPGLLEQGLDRMARRLLLKSRSLEEEGTPAVLYNDIGSRETVHHEEDSLSSPGLSPESDDGENSEDPETVRMQYRQLWELRATFEEEETTDCVEDLSSGSHGVAARLCNDEDDDDRPPGGFSTSLESEAADDPARTLNLSSDVRRQNYKVLLARRLHRKTESSADNSFDSMETDCSSTDASRTEGGVTTSSFDSTTDNTDGDGQLGHQSRLQQMKADSGYRSMESTNGNKPAKLSRKNVLAGQEGGSTRRSSALRKRRQLEGAHGQASSDDGASASAAAGTPADVSESPSDQQESSYYDVHGKMSVFHRFFRSSRRSSRSSSSKRILLRDYSIDYRSDQLFRKFSSQDPVEDSTQDASSTASPRLSTTRLLSPQLSIEEEGGSDASAMDDDWKAPCREAPVSTLPTD